MKKILLFVVLALAGRAGASSISFYHSNGGLSGYAACSWSGSAYVAGSSLGDGYASISYFAASNSWVVSGLSNGWEYTQGIGANPSNSVGYYLYRGGTNVVGVGGYDSLTFSGFPQIQSGEGVGGLWHQSGDAVAFSFSGTNAAGATNISPILVAVNEATLFTSPTLHGTNVSWGITGNLILDGTNLEALVNFSSSDPSNFFGGAAMVVTNFNYGTNSLALLQSTPSIAVTNSTLASPYLPVYDPYGAAQAATNGWPWLTAASNTWSLVAATNGMNSGDFRGPLNSNGLAWVAIWMSNGVPVIKQIAP